MSSDVTFSVIKIHYMVNTLERTLDRSRIEKLTESERDSITN